MQKLTYQIKIESSKDDIWNILWDKESYKVWAAAFHEGTYYEGELKEGAEILFLVPEGHGMFSIVDKLEVNNMVTFMHQGEMSNHKKGEIIYENAFESYILTDKDDQTLLLVELNCEEEYVDQMNTLFPKVLRKIKEIAENRNDESR